MSAPPKKGKTLPHNLDAEASILGGVILDNEALRRIPELEANHFYDPRHFAVFAAMRALEATERPIDIVTLEAELEAMGKLGAIGGVAFLGNLVALVPTADNVIEYAEIVRTLWRWRDLMLDAAKLLELGYSGEIAGHDPIGEAQEIAAQAARHTIATYMTLGQAVTDEIARVNDLKGRRDAGEDVYACLPFGFRDLDYNLGGAPFGQITVLEGLRAGAKTTAMQSMARNAAAITSRSKGKKLGVVALCYNEDQPAFFAQREIAAGSDGAIHTEQISRLTLDARSFRLFNEHGARVSKAPSAGLILIPCAGMDGQALGRVLLKIHAEFGLAGFFVDYLQRMKRPRGISSLPESIGANSHELGDIAQETGAAGVLAAQLKPEIETRDWKDEGGPIPRLGDCRYSNDPELDARLVLALFDRWKYGKRTLQPHVRYDPQPDRNNELIARNRIEIHCLKRNQGDAELMFMLEWVRESHLLRDLAPEQLPQVNRQLDLQRAADDEEAWNQRMQER